MSDLDNDDVSPLTHQVAGCHSGTPSSILINKKGHILKPYKPKPNVSFATDVDRKTIEEAKDLLPITLNELDFYAKIAKSEEPDFLALKEISPKYFGSKIINDIDHLVLEDFTHGMKLACVMDIKIGKDRYYPGRSPNKAKNDKIKYPCLQEFGFCIAGIKMCDPETGDILVHHMPMVARKFTAEEVAKHIKMFLNFDDEKKLVLREEILKGAQKVQEFSSKQTSIILRGSSLLLVYDAAALKGNATPTATELGARVGMIDFAHAFHSVKVDENYLEGMNNFVHLLKEGKLPSSK